MTTRRVITAGIALLLSVAALTSCSDDKSGVPGVPKYTPSASATDTSATSSAAATTASSPASPSSSTNASTSSTPATTGSTNSSTAAVPTTSATASAPVEPTPASSTAANGAVFTHMDAKDMPPKPAPPVAPQLPPQAFTKSDAGAIITAMTFVDTVTFMQLSGSAAEFDSLVNPACETCATYRKQILASYQKGGFAIISGRPVFDSLRVGEREGDALRVHGTLDMPSTTTYEPRDKVKIDIAAVKTDYIVDLAWVADRWLVTGAFVEAGA